MSAWIQPGLCPTDCSSGKMFRQGSEVCTLCDRSLSFTSAMLLSFCMLGSLYLRQRFWKLVVSPVLKKFMPTWFTWVNSKARGGNLIFLVCFFVLFCLMIFVLSPPFMDICPFGYCVGIRLETFEVSATVPSLSWPSRGSCFNSFFIGIPCCIMLCRMNH